jgi:hypothetical protein
MMRTFSELEQGTSPGSPQTGFLFREVCQTIHEANKTPPHASPRRSVIMRGFVPSTYHRWLQYSRHANIFRLVRIMMTTVLIMHYIACLFYAVSISRAFTHTCVVARAFLGAAMSLDKAAMALVRQILNSVDGLYESMARVQLVSDHSSSSCQGSNTLGQRAVDLESALFVALQVVSQNLWLKYTQCEFSENQDEGGSTSCTNAGTTLDPNHIVQP